MASKVLAAKFWVITCVFMALTCLFLSGCSRETQQETSSHQSTSQSVSSESTKESPSQASAQEESDTPESAKLRDASNCCLVGKLEIIEGSLDEYPKSRIWAALEFDKPAVYASKMLGDVVLDRMQLGPVATDGNDQAAFEPYESERILVKGTLGGATANFWHLTPCTLEDCVVVGAGEGNQNERRDEVAEGFAIAKGTNYRIENGEYVHEDHDRQQYISPTSELYEWKDGNDDGEEIMILGNPNRVESVKIREVIGDAYILEVHNRWPAGPSMNEEERVTYQVVVFNEDDLVEHAYYLEAYE